MISAEMLRRIHDVVEDLPPRCKLSFKLVKEYGFKYREAAEILQVSEKTIENQLAIALKKISAAIHFDIGTKHTGNRRLALIHLLIVSACVYFQFLYFLTCHLGVTPQNSCPISICSLLHGKRSHMEFNR